jgi:hypothetical protein
MGRGSTGSNDGHYAGRCRTTLDALVSSDHPTEAGVAGRLVELLCSAGAAVDGHDDDGSSLATALYFATLDCVSALIERGARTDNVVFAAAAGRRDRKGRSEGVGRHDMVIRPPVDPENRGRYSAHDGPNKEITIANLRRAAID